MRRRIDLTEVEERTKIRVRYLRALENEEWGILPGGAYTRSFIRTYATYLGLDGDRLADAFRQQHEDHAATRYPHVEPILVANDRPGRIRAAATLSPGVLGAIVVAVLVALLVVLGLTGGSDDEPATGLLPSREGSPGPPRRSPQPSPPARPRRVKLSLLATAEVWVCVVDAKDNELVDGVILQSGSRQGPFRSPSFRVNFGNGQIQMRVNGRTEEVPDAPIPVGYEIRPGGLRELGEMERPICQ